MAAPFGPETVLAPCESVVPVKVYHQSCVQDTFPYFRDMVLHANGPIIAHFLLAIFLVDHNDPSDLEICWNVSARVDGVV